MESSAFINECEKYIRELHRQFEKYQEITNTIFDKFHAVCEKRSIPYYYAFGNLLGLIRDNGNIPWDYDIDVLVPYAYENDLIQALKEELGEDYYYVYKDNMSHYPAPCLRVCKKGYTFMAFHVDVFFLFGCPSNKKKQKKFEDEIFWLYHARLAHAIGRYTDEEGSGIHLAIRRLISYIRYPISNRMLNYFERRIYLRYPLDEAERCMIFYPLRLTYSTKSFKNSRIVKVNNREFRIPDGYDLFLKERYGEYHNYLSISDRFDEFYRMTRIVEHRQKFYELQFN